MLPNGNVCLHAPRVQSRYREKVGNDFRMAIEEEKMLRAQDQEIIKVMSNTMVFLSI